MGTDEALFRFFMNRMRVTTTAEFLQFQADSDVLFFHRRIVAGTAIITSKAYFLRHLKVLLLCHSSLLLRYFPSEKERKKKRL